MKTFFSIVTLLALTLRDQHLDAVGSRALALGMEAHRRRMAGTPLPPWMSRTLKVADKVAFSKIRERLGGRLRIAASGAAPP